MPDSPTADPAGSEARRPAPMPHRYEVSLTWNPDATARLLAPPRPAITCASPPEFGGRPDHWSAQHLLLGSAGMCLLATFHALADRQRLPVEHCEAMVEGVLDKTPAGLRFTRVVVHVEVEVAAADTERARNLLMAARRHSIVVNSLDATFELKSTVHGT